MKNNNTSDILAILTKNAFGDNEHPFALYFNYNSTGGMFFRGFSGDRLGGIGDIINENTRFRLASVTKQFIARAVVELEHSGKLSFNDKLGKFFPDFPDVYAGIPLSMLLNHTSGIPDYEDMPDDGSGRQVIDSDVPEYLKTLGYTYFTPGSRYRYSNTCFVLLGIIIEKASGMPLTDAMKKLVFAPAKLGKTLVDVEGETIIPDRAYGHIEKDGRIIQKDQYRWSATIGDGGIYSCIDDLIKWIDNMLENNDRLSENMLRDAILPDGTPIGYGMGIRLKNIDGRRIICHTGATIGFNSALMYSPDMDLKLCFLTNREMNEPFDIINNALSFVFGRDQKFF